MCFQLRPLAGAAGAKGSNAITRIAQSYRRARMGSMRLARRAGTKPANTAMTPNSTTVIAATHGSFGLMP
jgi:hypothetical protein